MNSVADLRGKGQGFGSYVGHVFFLRFRKPHVHVRVACGGVEQANNRFACYSIFTCTAVDLRVDPARGPTRSSRVPECSMLAVGIRRGHLVCLVL